MAMRTRRGQSAIELMTGLLLLILLVSLLYFYAVFAVKGLKIQNHIRRTPAVISDEVTVDTFLTRFFSGDDVIHVTEPYGANFNPADSAITGDGIKEGYDGKN